MNMRWRLKLFVITLTLMGAAVLTWPVYGQDAAPLDSVLTIQPLEAQPIGVPVTITAQLSGSDGGPNPNKVLILYVNDEEIRRIRTDDKGLAAIRISRELSAAEYDVRVDFEGTLAYLPTSATTTLTVRPAELKIVTIPALANVPFQLDGTQFTTDEEGVARLEVAKTGDYQLEVLLEPDTEIAPDTRVTFDRWKDEFQPQRTVTIDGDVLMEAGFTVSHPVSQTFVDLNNEPVDMSRIESLTMKGSDGSSFTFEDGQERWLRGGRIARRQAGLEETQIQYSIESVLLNGSNTVNQFQQRFFVEPHSVWTIQLLLYYADFSAADALFGSPIGTGIKVEYPDGHTEILEFGESNTITIGPVPRGEYRIQVVGASGVAPVTPLALSRNQELDLKVLSNLNIALGAGLGFVGVFGLLLYGRPYLPLLVYRTTKDVATLRFLKGGAQRAKVQYLLPGNTARSGNAALLQSPQPNAALSEVEQAVIHMALTEPFYGRRRVSQELAKSGIYISVWNVRAIQLRHNLATIESRLAGLPSSLPQRTEPLVVDSHATPVAISEKSTVIASKHPGYLCAQDTYHVGSIEGIGDIYQQTFIDAYSGVALVKLYTEKDSQVAVDMLNNTVQPWFEQHNIVILNVMTDRGREFVASGRQKTHQYQDALATLGIHQVKSESQDAQSNDICAQFHETIRRGFYSRVLRKRKKYASLEAFQRAADKWLNRYNTETAWDGPGSQGETPIDRLHGHLSSGSSNGWHHLETEYAEQGLAEAALPS
jgi:hypothetical protein